MAFKDIIILVLVLLFKVKGDLLSNSSVFKLLEFSDEVDAHLPRLFHLDDYDRCLLQKNGLFCLGVFELSPINPSPTYDVIKVYSSNPYAFNRSRLHRGYCVSARCPSKRSEPNSTIRFEQCVDKRSKRLALSARLHTLHYCTTQEEYKVKMEQPPDTAQQLFMQIVYAFLVLNFVGTVYDFATKNQPKKKIELLNVWSMRASWRRLTAVYDDGDPRLKELELFHGGRVIALLFTIYVHCKAMHVQYFVTNPIFLENFASSKIAVLGSNGTSLIQMFVMIGTALTAYNILLYSEKHQIDLVLLPIWTLKRIVRIAPVHLLLVGYAATWWPQARSGALSAVIGEKSEICRRKFFTHAFFLNNVVEKYDVCLPPSWYIPVDMHLHIVTSILTIIMCRRRQHALRLYAMLFIISTAMCGVVNYYTGRISLVHLSVPENIRGIYRNVESYDGFYISTWGSLPACFAGLFAAHLHYELQEKNYYTNIDEKKPWIIWMQNWSVPVFMVWIVVVGSFMRDCRQPLVMALYVAVERPMFCCLFLLLFFSIFKADGPLRRFLSWRGWRVSARLSLPIMLCHWLIAEVISARPAAYQTSHFDMDIDFLAVVFYSHLVALPLSLLVEIPLQRLYAMFTKN